MHRRNFNNKPSTSKPEIATEKVTATPKSRTSYWLTRISILKLLGVVYFMAFLSAFDQIEGLVGSNGMQATQLLIFFLTQI